MEKGLQQEHQQSVRDGLLAGGELGLELKFGTPGLRPMPKIAQSDGVGILQTIHEGIKTATHLDELRASYRN